jgi:hypothetical protein
MPLKSLPTELDIKIIEALCPTNDRKALSALSRTSKYYRKLVEPMLYRDLTFRAVDDIQIKRLFLTFLVREDLPQHIRSFNLSGSPWEKTDSDWDVLAPGNLADDFWTHYQLIESAVLKLLLPSSPELPRPSSSEIPRPSSSALELCGDIFSLDGTSIPSRFAILTMILSMPTNIERIDLDSFAPYFLDYTRDVLGCVWIDEGDAGLVSFQLKGEVRKMRTQTFFFTPNF